MFREAAPYRAQDDRPQLDTAVRDVKMVGLGGVAVVLWVAFVVCACLFVVAPALVRFGTWLADSLRLS